MYTTEQKLEIAGKLSGNYGRYLTDEDKEDIAQDMLVAMLEAERKADQSRNVNAYTFTTGKGTALNTVNRIAKHNKRHETLNVTIEESEEGTIQRIDLVESTDKGFVESTIEGERASAIESAISSLPTVQASAVKRILRDGATLESFGAEQGFSKERARQILVAARETLAIRLKEWEATV